MKFEEVWPRTPERDALLIDLGSSVWRIALAALYLSTGRCIPEDAKKKGAYFGFCNEVGEQQPKKEATHLGWTVE